MIFNLRCSTSAFVFICFFFDLTDHLTYLHYPHFHFAGRFRADTATLNNFPNLYNPENIAPSETQPNADNWNPMGSGEWAVEAEVTHVCYSDYRCVGNVPDEPLCGAYITGNYYITSGSPRAGKMNQTLLCNWLLERERKRYLACGIIRGTNRDYPLSRKKNFSDSYVINLSSSKLVRSRWLNIGFVLFFFFFLACFCS